MQLFRLRRLPSQLPPRKKHPQKNRQQQRKHPQKSLLSVPKKLNPGRKLRQKQSKLKLLKRQRQKPGRKLQKNLKRHLKKLPLPEETK